MILTRDEVIERAKAAKIDYMGLYTHQEDHLATLYHITPSGKMVDYMSKPVPKSATFEGYLDYSGNSPRFIPFTDDDGGAIN